MNAEIANADCTPKSGDRPGRGLIECGLWVRLGLIGALAVPAGLLALFEGDASPTLALAAAIGGGLLAAFSRRRVRTLLGVVDGDASMTAGAASPTGIAASGGPALRASPMQGGRSLTAVAAERYTAPQAELSS